MIAETENHKLLKIREDWVKYANLESFSGLTIVHWRYWSDIKNLLAISTPNFELPCTSYSNPTYTCDYIGGFGIAVSGQIVLAGKQDLGTRTMYFPEYKIMVTDAKERLCFECNLDNPPYELIIKNWKPTAIVFDFNKIKMEYENPIGVLKDAVKTSRELQIPIISSE